MLVQDKFLKNKLNASPSPITGLLDRSKNTITDACSIADCCPLLKICPRCCPRHAPDDAPDDAPDMPQVPRWCARHAPVDAPDMPQTCPRWCPRQCPRHGYSYGMIKKFFSSCPCVIVFTHPVVNVLVWIDSWAQSKAKKQAGTVYNLSQSGSFIFAAMI